MELNHSYPCVQALCALTPLGSADIGNIADEYRLVLDHPAKINIALSDYYDDIKYTEITVYQEGDKANYADKLLTNKQGWTAPDPYLECTLSPGTYFLNITLFPYEGIEQDTAFGTPYVLTLTEKDNDAPVLKTISSSIEGPLISWEAVPDAAGYKVYRRTITENDYDVEEYSVLAGDVSGTSYLDTTGELGQKYGYTVSAVKKDGTETAYDQTGLTGGKLFSDVIEGKFYYDAVLWAVGKGITTGTGKSTFSPDASCTRAQMVTFLWRAAGEQEPSLTQNPFEDVGEQAYYYKAVLWAVENNITKGMTETTFEPNTILTRGQTAAFLFRAQKDAAAPSVDNPFKDVREKSFYYDAVLWAFSNGVTKGMSDDSFAPEAFCTRGQIVTFLWRSNSIPDVS